MAEGGQYTDFIGGLVRGDVSPPTSGQLDALLHWLVGRHNPAAESIAAAFHAQGVAEDSAQERTLLYLDAVLFSHEKDPYRLFGLMPGCDLDAIRARHKRLLQVFHPDRHKDHEQWFTERSERLNQAYAYLKAHHGRPHSTLSSATITPPPAPRRPARTATAPARSPWQSLAANRGALRRQLKAHLGSSDHLERRVYIILFAVPVVLLVVVYLKQSEPLEQHKPAAPVNTEEHTQVAGNGPAAIHLRKEAAASSSSALPQRAAATPAPEQRPAEHSPASESIQAGTTATPAKAWPNTRHNAWPNARPRHHLPPTRAHAAVHRAATTPAPEQRPAEHSPASDSILAGTTATPANAWPNARPRRHLPPPRTHTAAHVDEKAPAARAPDTMKLAAADTRQAQRLAKPLPAAKPPRAPREQAAPRSTTIIETAEAATADTAAPGQGPAPRDPAPAAPKPKAAKPERRDTKSQPTPTPIQAAKAETTPAQQPADDLAAVKALLRQYRSAYNRSDIDQFARLFGDNAETKHARNRTEITRKYEALFQRTSERDLVFSHVRITKLGNHEYRVNTRYTVNWTYPDGESKTDTGQFEMLLVRVDNELKIRRLDY